jgi:electron transport complex protein RnfD
MSHPSKYLEMELRTSPHVAREVSVEIIMRNVVYALAPIVAVAVYVFGVSALLLVLTTTVSAVLTEFVLGRLSGKGGTLGDYSAVITGMLLGLTLPPGFPLWMAAVGGFVAIALGKALFGGLGFNVFNPALVGRAFLQAAFPVAITTWYEPFGADRFGQALAGSVLPPFSKLVPDALTGATPLAAMKFDHQITAGQDLFLGGVSGSAGETSAILILLCGVYLAVRSMLDWRIPVGILATVFFLSGLLHWIRPDYPSPVFMLFSGGLMLGAVFMATDMVTSPVTPWAVWIFAFIVGALTVVIRLWGGLPEGVMYAILLANGMTPMINRLTQPRVYGVAKKA